MANAILTPLVLAKEGCRLASIGAVPRGRSFVSIPKRMVADNIDEVSDFVATNVICGEKMGGNPVASQSFNGNWGDVSFLAEDNCFVLNMKAVKPRSMVL